MRRPTAELVRELTSELEPSLGGPTQERRREVEVLLAHVLGLADRTDLYTADVDVSDSAAAIETLRSLVSRRARGEPVAYLIGSCEFHGRVFEVTPDVLIPRPETEHVVEVSLAHMNRHAEPRVLDIGVGSGAIAITLLIEHPGARAVATDISGSALEIARRNAVRLGVADRLTLQAADLLPPSSETFDVVVSNPPYVALGDSLPDDVREYEPEAALYAGPSGLDVIERIVGAAAPRLRPGGALVIEVGAGQAVAVRALLEAMDFEEITVAPDLAGIERVASAVRPR